MKRITQFFSQFDISTHGKLILASLINVNIINNANGLNCKSYMISGFSMYLLSPFTRLFYCTGNRSPGVSSNGWFRTKLHNGQF